MGKQYYGQVESITGNSYTVELHHKTLTPIPPATAKEINLSAGGFELDYEGQGSATYENNIMGSSCTIQIAVDDTDVFYGLEQMAESRENDWLMIILLKLLVRVDRKWQGFQSSECIRFVQPNLHTTSIR